MPNAVLVGDSIFDNASYVPGELPVIDQLRGFLPKDWRATLLAVDGDITADVANQLRNLPNDATHLVVSTGGNDALGCLPMLSESAHSVAEVLGKFAQIRETFRSEYRYMLARMLETGRSVAICTVYDCVPDLEPMAHTALSMFNEVILREAFSMNVPVVDLRLVSTEEADYSSLSPIEPSCRGGAKIAKVVSNLLLGTTPSERATLVHI